MKWFKHDTDMHTDLKIQALMDKHGLYGYAIWNLCLELVGKEGSKGRLKGETRWQEGLLKVVSRSSQGQDKVSQILTMVDLKSILNDMAELGLICSKSLNYGNLYVLKFAKRMDNYTLKKLRTEDEQYADNVSVEKNKKKIRREDIIKVVSYYKQKQGFSESDITSFFWKRNGACASKLLVASDGDVPKVCKAIDWVSTQGYNWTLETVLKQWEFANRESVKPREWVKYL